MVQDRVADGKGSVSALSMVKPRRQPTPQTVPVHQGVSLGVTSSADETFPKSLDVNGLSDKISPPVGVNLIPEKDEILPVLRLFRYVGEAVKDSGLAVESSPYKAASICLSSR